MKKRKIIYFTILVLWYAFIFGHSVLSRTNSAQESGGVLELLIKLGFPSWVTENLVRKTAHFIEYFILGGLLVTGFPVLSKKVKYVYPAFFALLSAVTDEFIQLFSGRGSMVSDVVLDFASALIGMLLVRLFYIKAIKKDN